MELPDSIPRILAVNPFGPVNNMVGAEGERWLPVHGLRTPLRGEAVLAEVEAVYERNRDTLEQFSIETGYLITVVSEQITVLEPVFFWPDGSMRCTSTASSQIILPDSISLMPYPTPGTRSIASGGEVVDVLSAEGASHMQLGKAYHYHNALKAPALDLVTGIKNTLSTPAVS